MELAGRLLHLGHEEQVVDEGHDGPRGGAFANWHCRIPLLSGVPLLTEAAIGVVHGRAVDARIRGLVAHDAADATLGALGVVAIVLRAPVRGRLSLELPLVRRLGSRLPMGRPGMRRRMRARLPWRFLALISGLRGPRRA